MTETEHTGHDDASIVTIANGRLLQADMFPVDFLPETAAQELHNIKASP